MRRRKRKVELTELHNFRVTPDEEKETLASLVRSWLPECSWNSAKDLITSRRVQVNGNLCVDDARRMKAGEVVRVSPTPFAKPVQAKAVKIAFMDEHLVVFEKPTGVTSVRHFEERKMHVRRKQLQPTLQELAPKVIARKIYEVRHDYDAEETEDDNVAVSRRRRQRTKPEIEALIDNAARQHAVLAVHRLDRDTSGLIMYARTAASAAALGKMFKAHTIDRRYIAVCVGDVPDQTLVSYMVRDRGDGRRGSIEIREGKVPGDARRAVTHIRKLKSIADGKYTLVECKLETGRTHQIRIHLAEAGHIICGERIYNKTKLGEMLEDRSHAPRQALHAGRLKFQHPMTKASLSLQMPLPHDLQQWLTRLES